MTQTIPAPLRAYLETATVALAIASVEGDTPLLFVNDRFTRLTGYAPEEIVGRNCRMIQGDAPNLQARALLRGFLADPAQANVRTPIINFRRDGTPFVNLLYMSRLRAISGAERFFFASQFDISRSHPDLLAEYDTALGGALTRMTPVLKETGIVLEGSLIAIANTAAAIAQARVMLADLDGTAS